MKTLSKIAIFLIIAKGFGFAKELLLLSRFGFSKDLDEYNLVIVTSLASAGFIVSVVNNYFIDYFKECSTDSLIQLIPKILFFCPVVPLMYLVIMMRCTSLSAGLISLGSLIILIYSFSSILSAFIMAKKMLLNSYLEFIPAFLTSIGILSFEEITTYQLILIFLIGISVQVLVYLKCILRSRFDGTMGSSISLVSLSTIVSAQFIVLVVPFIDSFVLIEDGQGELAGFSFAQRLIGTGMALITLIATRYILPLLGINSTKHELNNFTKITRFILLSLIVLVLVGEVILLRLAIPEVLAKYVSVLLIYIPFYTYNIIMLNAHVALGNYKILLFTAVIGIVVKILVYGASIYSEFLWVPWSLVAMTIMSTLYISSKKLPKYVSQ